MIKLIVKFSQLTWDECGPCPIFAFFTVAFGFHRIIKARKNSIQGSPKVPISAN